MKDKKDRLMKKVYEYKTEKNELGKSLVKADVAGKEMTRCCGGSQILTTCVLRVVGKVVKNEDENGDG